MKILVTGGAGFVGSHVVDACIRAGHEVVCVDKLDIKVHREKPYYLNSEATYLFEDLRDLTWQEDLDGIEAIIHLAAIGGVGRAMREKEEVISNNCVGTARLVALAGQMRDLRRFIHVSSFSVYGNNYFYQCQACQNAAQGFRKEADLKAGRFEVYCKCGSLMQIMPLSESAEPKPLEVYAASKYMQELALLGLPENVPVHILRMSSVYGTRLRLEDGEATIIARLLGWIQRGELVSLFEDGKQLRDWVSVQDVTAGILNLIQGKSKESLIHVCSGHGTSLMEACKIISSEMGLSARYEITGKFRAGDIRHCVGDAGRITTLLGRSPLGFREGIRQVLAEQKIEAGV